MKGSLTVEAAFVFPFCFAVIGVICYLGVFGYNQAVLKLTAYECILQSLENRELDDKSFERELTELLQRKAEGRMLTLENIQTSVKVTGFYITAEFRAVQKMIFSQPVQAEVTYRKTYPEKVLRAVFAGKGNK